MRVCMHGYVWVRVRCTFVCLRATVDDRWAILSKFCNNHSKNAYAHTVCNAYAHTRQQRTPPSAREAAEYVDEDKFANTSSVTANLFMIREMVVIDSMLAKNTGRGKLLEKAPKSSLLKTPFFMSRSGPGAKCGPIQKYWTALCTFDCSAMAKKRSCRGIRCPKRPLNQVRAGSPSAHRWWRYDCACVGQPGASPARLQMVHWKKTPCRIEGPLFDTAKKIL